MRNRSAILIANFIEKNHASRPYLMYKYLTEQGFTVKVYYCTWSHSFKKHRIIQDEDFYPIHSLEYKSNISIKRIASHAIFAIRSYALLKKSNANLVYTNLPPNILGLFISFLKPKKKFVLLTDVLDLWPESFPLPPFLDIIFKSTLGPILKWERERVLKKSDLIITESEYFYEKLKLDRFVNTGVIHLKKIVDDKALKPLDCNNILTIGYIGNIGKVYDFDSLVEVLSQLNKKRAVHFSIIGEGEYKEILFSRLNANNISYTYLGATFDEKIKEEVLSSCWFGYNGFKENTEIALSYKTIEYFSFGLPILNSAKGDTYEIVNSNKVGFNFQGTDITRLIDILLKIKKQDVLEMKFHTLQYFDSNFSYNSFEMEMTKLLSCLNLNNN